MRLFSTTRTFTAEETFIPFATVRIKESFETEGYKFDIKSESCCRTTAEIQRVGVLNVLRQFRGSMS